MRKIIKVGSKLTNPENGQSAYIILIEDGRAYNDNGDVVTLSRLQRYVDDGVIQIDNGRVLVDASQAAVRASEMGKITPLVLYKSLKAIDDLMDDWDRFLDRTVLANNYDMAEFV